MNEKDSPKSYKVILKSGDYGVFTNNNHFENYPDRLLSGVYGIVNGKGDNLPITPETVLRIEEVTEEEASNS